MKLQKERKIQLLFIDILKTLAILYYKYYVLHIIIYYITYIYIYWPHYIYGEHKRQNIILTYAA